MRFAVVAVNTPDRTDMACFLTIGVDVSGIGFLAAGVAYVLQSTEFGKRFVQPVVPGFHRSLVPPEVADFVAVFLSTYSLNVRELSIMKFLRLYPPEVPEAESRNFM